MQLDTGLDVSVLYGTAWAEEAGLKIQQGEGYRFVEADLELGGAVLKHHKIFIMDYEPDDNLGSIGMGSLLGKALAIDFKAATYCVLDTMPDSLAAHSAFTQAQVVRNRIFPQVYVGQTLYRDLFYDSGSSATALLVDREPWQALTGRREDDPEVETVNVGTWGKQVAFGRTKTKESFHFGEHSFGPVIAYHRLDRPTLFEDWPMPVRGLIGNTQFLDGVMLIDTTSTGPRFGFVPPESK